MKLDSQINMTCNNLLSGKFSVLYQARYCAQEDINLIVCKDGIIKVFEPPLSFTSGKPVCYLLKTNRDSKLVVSGSNVYLFGESEQKASFVKYSESSKSWNMLPSFLDERSRFCSFMQKIIVIGGIKNKKLVSSFMANDIKTNKWTQIASMNKRRENTSCTVFKGKVVVTGGWIKTRSFFNCLKSVKAYCFHENKWTQLPGCVICMTC